MTRLFLFLVLGLTLGGFRSLHAERVKLIAVETTDPRRPKAELSKAVDGIEASPNGWVVEGKTDNVQSAVFRCAAPLSQGRLRLWLCFLSGKPNSHFREFSLATTRDPQPSLNGRWDPLFPVWFNAAEGELTRKGGHLRADGATVYPVFRIDAALALDGVTGLRIDSYPTKNDGGAVLTEFRVDRITVSTTNIALGCPVTASHELAADQRPEFLTDGLSGTFTHPLAPDLGGAFYYEIDLRGSYALDHISVRSRADSRSPERLSRVVLRLYETDPALGGPAMWTGHQRENGTYPEPGQTDVVRAAAGTGTFRGRYLRISSDSPVAFSPQIAEVEVYESLVPPGVSVQAGNQTFPAATHLEIPASSPWLSFAIQHPAMATPFTLGRRWRLIGWHDAWLPVTGTGVVESRGLPPGRYIFEAQVRHTDNEWNAAGLSVNIVVPNPWWKNPFVQAGAAMIVISLAMLGGERIARRRTALRLADLERRQALDRERARIARDMHDVVGARLTQLAVMQEIFATEHVQSPAARDQLHRLTGTAREAVAALDEAVWAVNPRNDTLQNVADYLCHAGTDYLEPLGITCRQDVDEEWPSVTVGAQKRHQLLRAFKEALQNIVKHANASEVLLGLHHEAPDFVVRLEDNGRGLPEILSGEGRDGLDNMRDRLTDVKGIFTILPRRSGGTVVEMRIPL